MVSINQLREEYKEHSLDSSLILSKLLNKDKAYIYAFGEKELSKETVNLFIQLMDKRKAGYPLQYILGEWEFMGLNFYLEEGVLIPRPDTEILVEYIIETLKNESGNKKANILELGIGSGAICLSLAHYLENVHLYGVDISSLAIRVANINRERFGLTNVDFYLGDLFTPINKLALEGSFHMIVSNPPYIARKDIDKLQKEVRDFEPRLALDGGEDGLDFYRSITGDARAYLIKGGLLIYEIGYNQAEEVKSILKKEGFEDIRALKDLQGFERVIMGTKGA